MIVGIDGPAGSGKGTVTKEIAKRMGLVNFDTGATYRCVALESIRKGIPLTDEEGIKCPNDGLVNKSISDLKVLNNFITDKTITQRTSTNCLIPQGQLGLQNNFTNSNNNINNYYSNMQYKTCEIHKGQKLTHFIEETKELICVYCAFERFKQNQGIEIKEIIDKCREMEQEMDCIIEENQYNVGIIQTSLKEIKKNKENEEKK